MPSLIILSSFCLLLRRVIAHKTYYTPCSTFAYAFDLHPHHRRVITLKQYHHPYYNPNPLLDFYRTNFHERPSKKLVPSLPKKADGEKISDVMYILTSSHQDQDEIMAALRLTKSKNDEKYTFLRSLCVAIKYRRCGLASKLVNESLQHFDVHYCYCFASPDLAHFYQKLGFTLASSMQGEAQSKFIPRWMVNSYESMANRNRNRKELKLYIKQEPASHRGANIPDGKKNLTEIVLLQHYTEKSKQTATGWLLNDTQYSEYFGIDAPMSDDDLVESKMKLTLWTWSGSNDIAMIEDQINRLKDNNRTVYLLWTGGGDASANNVTSPERNSCESKVGESYIIIDGTWQQAKKIYRKTRALWALPRVSFQGNDVPTSKYYLRGDYSGWRERFSSNSEEDGNDLLCTAEVAAAVVDKCGDKSCGNLIRSRLDAFQSSFPQRQKKKFRGDTKGQKMRAKPECLDLSYH